MLEIFNYINDPCQYPSEMIFSLNSKGKVSQRLVTPPTGFFQETEEVEDYEIYIQKE